MNNVLDWVCRLLKDLAPIYNFVNSIAFSINGVDFSVLSILTLGGLVTFLGVAVVKWLIS